MKKALVLGASGGIGYALVRELISREVEVIAFARGEEKLTHLFNNEVKIMTGDALVEKDVMAAAEDVDVIFHAVSFPYEEWSEKHPLCLEVVINVAKKQKAKVVLVDNIYAYGKQPTPKVKETSSKNPHTKKGKIRLDMEATLKNSGVTSLIVHLPDVYGPNANNTILYETLKSVVNNKTANYVGSMKVAREFVYTQDAAKAVVSLALRDDSYNENWNIPAVNPITGENLIQILRAEAGFTKKVRTVSKTMIQFLGLFQPFMREVVEMMYLTEEPIHLCGEKFQTKIGPIPQTPYQHGLKETLNWMKVEGGRVTK